MNTVDENFEIDYEWYPGTMLADDRILQECSVLYSEHYGQWKDGKPVKLSVQRLKEWINIDSTAIYLARDKCSNSKLVGYAIALRKKGRCGIISWITQLVVHKDYRNKTIAKQLLHSVWCFSNDYAWGIISANPYAIRALENVTHRRCEPCRIKKDKDKILAIGQKSVIYIDEGIEVEIGKNESLINTKFLIDHSNIPSMLQDVEVNTEWKLGAIRDGWEWFAFTFRDQPQIEHSEKEIEHFLAHSDKNVKDAYRRMDLLSANQKWAKYTNDEVGFIIKECQLRQGDTVLDLGCGTGRHSFALAQQGMDVTAVDYIDDHFNRYKDMQQSSVRFFCDDSRYLTSISGQKFNAVICLYDVIGSYVSQEDNIKILRQIYNHLEKGGYAIISVMNYGAVPSKKIDEFSFEKLQSLEPSQTMETTGDIFNSDLMLVDKESQVLYRKEQFDRGEHLLPIELVVRDRRFRKNEIEQMCVSVGFETVFSRYVRAGNWDDTPLLNTADTAKEILIKCRK